MSKNDSNKIQTYIFEEINTKEELNKVEEEEKLFEMNKKNGEENNDINNFYDLLIENLQKLNY